MLASYELQKAIFTALSDMTVPLYADVPEGAGFPYVRYDNDVETDESSKTEEYFRVLVTLNVFSRENSFKEVKEIASEVRGKLLTMPRDITGYKIDYCKVVSISLVDDYEHDVKQATVSVAFKLS